MKVYCCYDTPRRPFVHGDLDGLTIQGRCLLEADVTFWTNLINWVDSNKENFDEFLIVEIFIDYASSMSHRFLLSLVHKLNEFCQKTQIILIWKYEKDDDDLKELGQILKDHAEFIFEFRSIESYRANPKSRKPSQFPEIAQRVLMGF